MLKWKLYFISIWNYTRIKCWFFRAAEFLLTALLVPLPFGSHFSPSQLRMIFTIICIYYIFYGLQSICYSRNLDILKPWLTALELFDPFRREVFATQLSLAWGESFHLIHFRSALPILAFEGVSGHRLRPKLGNYIPGYWYLGVRESQNSCRFCRLWNWHLFLGVLIIIRPIDSCFIWGKTDFFLFSTSSTDRWIFKQLSGNSQIPKML